MRKPNPRNPRPAKTKWKMERSLRCPESISSTLLSIELGRSILREGAKLGLGELDELGKELEEVRFEASVIFFDRSKVRRHGFSHSYSG